MNKNRNNTVIPFDQILDIVNRELDNLPLRKDPPELYDPIAYILRIGGKRLRPALVLMSCNLFADETGPAVKPALGVEIFHNFTLLHDDVMDRSMLRRNKPTVHNKWNDNIAMLSGDAMSILAYQLISECPDPVLRPVLDLFSKTALQVCEGQQYDMNFESEPRVSTGAYLKMTELKTAVLIAASMGIGALIGMAGARDVQLMYEFGKNIGMAFQIRDDYLDVYGASGIFGKRIGQDILANKKTYLLTRSLELAGRQKRNELEQWLGKKDHDPQEKIAAVTAIYDQLEMKRISETAMKEYYRSALDKLDEASVKDIRKREIRALVDLILYREQ